MKISRILSGAAAAAVLGSVVLNPAGAAAVEPGQWRAYGNTNPVTSSPSTWKCRGTETIGANVYAQVCALRSAGGTSVQAAVIVRNNRSSLYSVAASMDLVNTANYTLGDWECAASGVGPNSWSVCFGNTLSYASSVNSAGTANGILLGVSPYV